MSKVKHTSFRNAFSKVAGVGILVLVIAAAVAAYAVMKTNIGKPSTQSPAQSTKPATSTQTSTSTSQATQITTHSTSTATTPSQTPQNLVSDGLTPGEGADKIKIVGYQVYYTVEEESGRHFNRLHVKICAVAKESGTIVFYKPNGEKALSSFFKAGEGTTCHTYGIGGYNATLAPGTWKIVFINPLNRKVIATWYWDVRSDDVKINWIKVTMIHKDGIVAFTLFQVSLTNNGNVPIIFATAYVNPKTSEWIAGPWAILPPQTTKVFTVANKNPMIGLSYAKSIEGYFAVHIPSKNIKIPYTLIPPPKGQTKTITVKP